MKAFLLKLTLVFGLLLIIIKGNAQPGTLDSSFGVNGNARITYDTVYASSNQPVIAIQDDGKILLVGNRNSGNNNPGAFMLARLLENGVPDSSFGKNGFAVSNIDINQRPDISAITIQKDGKIILGGTTRNYNDFALLRFKANGYPDSSFGVNSLVVTDLGYDADLILSLAVQNDGKIVASGMENGNGCLVRYNAGFIFRYKW